MSTNVYVICIFIMHIHAQLKRILCKFTTIIKKDKIETKNSKSPESPYVQPKAL